MQLHSSLRALLFGCAMAGSTAFAQDTSVHVLRTGGGSPLSGGSIVVAPFPVGGDATLEFEFGFGTEETPTPGGLHDSFTASVEAGSGIQAFVVTTDVFGSQWTPPNPGGAEFLPSSVTASAISLPIVVAPAELVGAYHVKLVLPDEFRAQPLTLHFDLFDNGDALGSVGFYNAVVSVPEPPVVALVAVGLALLAMAAAVRRGAPRDPFQ